MYFLDIMRPPKIHNRRFCNWIERDILLVCANNWFGARLKAPHAR